MLLGVTGVLGVTGGAPSVLTGDYWGCAKFDDIEWHSGFQPLMAFNGSALQGVLNDGRFAIQRV